MHSHPIQPAYDTKHIKILEYDLVLPFIPKQDLHLSLMQDDAGGLTTGTTLWLGGQVLAAYLLSLRTASRKSNNAKLDVQPLQAIELGSGIGFTALLLAASGCNVIATDLPLVVDNILLGNIERNLPSVGQVPASGKISALPLDWFSAPEDWNESIQSGTFDFIFTSDSIYMQNLVEPLLQTIYELCIRQMKKTEKVPDVYLAYEHRDDAQYDSFTSKAEAKDFKVKKIAKSKISKAVQGLYGWKTDVYDGVTVLLLKLNR